MRYLLPCPCGQALAVEPSQAGQTVNCRCGAALEVPTMRNLVRLPRAEREPAAAAGSRAWGLRHRLVLAGLLLVAVGLGLAGYFTGSRPVLSVLEPTREVIRGQLETLSPLETWQSWQVVRAERLQRHNPADSPAYLEAVFRYHLALGLSLLLAVSGIGLIIAARWADGHQEAPGSKSARAGHG